MERGAVGLVGLVDGRCDGRTFYDSALAHVDHEHAPEGTRRGRYARACHFRDRAVGFGLGIVPNKLPAALSLYPFIIWTALRFRQRETTAAIAVLCGLAIWATSHGMGPWTSGSLDSRLVQLDSWMAVLAITGLVLGAVTAERRAARKQLQVLLAQTKHSVETLQTAFLPEQLPQRVGLRSDVLYIAADHEALIGGDWYDAFALPDGRVAFSIGDVTGHGLDAAVSAARLRRSILLAAFEVEDPAEILDKADHAVGSRQKDPATALVAILSRDLRSVSYASAGHPPPIVAGPNTPALALEYGGVPFGVGIPIASLTHTAALEPGAAILSTPTGSPSSSAILSPQNGRC